MMQLLLPLLIAVITLTVCGKHAALSALLGGLVGTVPSLLFAKKFFQSQGARAARQIVKNFYRGEFIKIISSMCFFTVIFKLYNVAPVEFFLTYIAVIMTYWFCPLMVNNK